MSEKTNAFPSTAKLDSQGRYLHCPLNQPLAEAEAKGLTGAHDLGQLKHRGGQPGYCARHTELGCVHPDCN